MLGGRTGSGKTQVLKQLDWSMDLEGVAQHRGSAFGAKSTPQPTPVKFEFMLAQAALNHSHRSLLVEDESRTIGRLATPTSWFEQMQRAPIVLLQASLETRVAHIVEEYVTEPLTSGHNPQALLDTYRDSLRRIKRRLGGKCWQEIDDLLQRAFGTGDHTTWVEALLRSYYDPMYDYQLTKKQARVVFKGDATAVVAHLRSVHMGRLPQA